MVRIFVNHRLLAHFETLLQVSLAETCCLERRPPLNVIGHGNLRSLCVCVCEEGANMIG